MKKYINKGIDNLKVAPYGETLIFIGLLSELIPGTNYIFLGIFSLIGGIETYNSFQVKERLENILEKNKGIDINKILDKYKKHFCYRQAAIAALKNKGQKEQLDKFYEILDDYKKHADDILMGVYFK